ncbi:uncharacterized protein LOC127876112 [Dreissena polymorpha]|uniref:uncharacterized protein LOC127876112 n=1 Tax=Dreissena polymorpha TaxID=45954 RepID=UPI002263FED9|nr:uncharacterized protein LOC127876112 [Dreissena polymorpha]
MWRRLMILIILILIQVIGLDSCQLVSSSKEDNFRFSNCNNTDVPIYFKNITVRPDPLVILTEQWPINVTFDILVMKNITRMETINAKSEVLRERNHAAATGGGPQLPEMSQTSQAVASLFANTASFHGIVDDADTLIADTPPSPSFLGLPMLDIIAAMDIPDPFGVAETVQDNTSRTKEKTTATSVPSTSTTESSDTSRKRTLKDAQLEALERQAEMCRAGADCFRKVARLADLLIAKLDKQ